MTQGETWYLTLSKFGRIVSKRAVPTLPRYNLNRNESLKSQNTTLAPTKYEKVKLLAKTIK